jgi:hypothetical protein
MISAQLVILSAAKDLANFAGTGEQRSAMGVIERNREIPRNSRKVAP